MHTLIPLALVLLSLLAAGCSSSSPPVDVGAAGAVTSSSPRQSAPPPVASSASPAAVVGVRMFYCWHVGGGRDCHGEGSAYFPETAANACDGAASVMLGDDVVRPLSSDESAACEAQAVRNAQDGRRTVTRPGERFECQARALCVSHR